MVIRIGDYVQARADDRGTTVIIEGHCTKALQGRYYLANKYGVLYSCMEADVISVTPFADRRDPYVFAFEVPFHRDIYMRVPGKLPGTVLVVEQTGREVCCCEYTEPLFYERVWCYPTLLQAILETQKYVTGALDEPEGWERSVTPELGIRRRNSEGKIVVEPLT